MNNIFVWLDELNKYSSLILMFATLVYVYFTYKLTKETTKLREVETTPFMSLYIKPDYLLKLVIENVDVHNESLQDCYILQKRYITS